MIIIDIHSKIQTLKCFPAFKKKVCLYLLMYTIINNVLKIIKIEKKTLVHKGM